MSIPFRLAHVTEHCVLKVHPQLARLRTSSLFSLSYGRAVLCLIPRQSGPPGGFHPVATANNAAVNVGGQNLKLI